MLTNGTNLVLFSEKSQSIEAPRFKEVVPTAGP